MGKALVVKNVDFTTNALDTVSFNDIPCTGITLDQASASITVATTLTETVTPANTTDSVVWTSSDSTVATVTNGVVTPVAAGSATITATCGSHSATCAVTVIIAVTAAKGVILNYIDNQSNPGDYASVTTNSKMLTFGAANGERKCNNNYDVYPYPIPSGATSITVKCTNFGIMFVFYNSDEAQTASTDASYANAAKALDGETQVAGWPNSISAWTYSTRTITIPETAGINSFTVGMYCSNSTQYDAFDVNDPPVTVTFGYD